MKLLFPLIALYKWRDLGFHALFLIKLQLKQKGIAIFNLVSSWQQMETQLH